MDHAFRILARTAAALAAALALAGPQVALAAITVFNVVVEGGQEVPPTQAPGTGSGTATVDTTANTITLNIAFSGISPGGVTAAHLHGSAARGVNAPVKFAVGTTSPITNVLNYSEADEADILAGLWYLNIHSSMFPGGEIRGQLDNIGFSPKLLVAVPSGTGTGTITSDPAGIACGATCSANFAHGTNVTVTATPAPGSAFAGWSAACSGPDPSCIVAMTAVRGVVAIFDALPVTVFNVVLEGAQEVPSNAATGGGSGTATVDPAANTITLDVSFSGLSSAVTGAHLHGPAARGVNAPVKFSVGTASPITNVLNYDEADEAAILAGNWYLNVHTTTFPGGELRGQLDGGGAAAKSLHVAVDGTGQGSVISLPAGIDCSASCDASFAHATPVTLTAIPKPGSAFAGWSGACSGTATECAVTMSVLRSVTATFSLLPTVFDVYLEGAQEVPANASGATGSGTASVDTVANTITLNLTFSGIASAVTGAHLHGPAARGVNAPIKSAVATTSPITSAVGYDEADEAAILAGNWYLNVHSATFPGGEIRGQLDGNGRAAKTLTVTRTGDAASVGSVTSSPAGIDCGADCAEGYAHATVVTLTATAGPSETFNGWGGACLAFGTAAQCTVTMDALKSAQAVFTMRPEGDTDNDGIPNSVEPVEGRDPFTKDNDIFANARLFAMQQYRDFLNREGDAIGIAGWSDFITAGTYTRTQVVDAFLSSQEFAGFTAPVVRLYFAFFLRVPDYAGLTYNAGLVRSGLTLQALADFFAASPEFTATYGALDNAQYVTLLYGNVLGRAPDPAGLAGWVALLDGGTYSRGQVMLGFSESVEYQAAMENEVFVTMMYAGMLRRTPEPGGFGGWLGFLDAGTYTRAQVIDGFLYSVEYHGRFLP